MSLEEYRRKRNFDVTLEPRNNTTTDERTEELLFVVQKHAARNLHFDLRLEVAGVYKSWAVPLGPSLDPKVKRLAVEVEDHPLSYGTFEGTIPPRQYGAGSVIVWDRGTWRPDSDPTAALATGKLRFELSGERLRGSWTLVRTRRKSEKPQWLLIKHQDNEASTTIDLVESHIESVVSWNTLETVGGLPEFIEPKLPSLTEKPPSGDEWLHELKLDGYRMQAQWRADRFQLMTRSGVDWTSRFSRIADELSKLPIQGTIIDGELVAIDEKGKSDFGSLQNGSDQKATIAFFAFDLLYDRNRDLRNMTLLQRKSRLKEVCDRLDRSRIQFLDHIQGSPDALIEQCKLLGLEGIVSKRVDRSYSSGRAGDWLKTKFRYRENLIIGGFDISSDCKSLSSLLVGYLDESRELKFAGRVGTGWSQAWSAKLIKTLTKLVIPVSPFDEKISSAKVSRDTTIHFIEPTLVAEVAFGNWTKSRQLRHASFHSLKEVAPELVTADSLFADQQPSTSKNLPQPATRTKVASTPLPGLSNQQRVLYPQDQFTKEDVAAYLFQVSQWILPHIADRPVSFLRCTDTIEGDQYFQRHPGRGFPASIEAVQVASESKPLICVSSTDALLATAQIAAIELHPWGCRRDRMDRPDRIIIDLDPDTSIAWSTVIEAALIVRNELIQCGLQSFVKTTGGKGLHVVVPIARRYEWTKVFDYSKAFAQQLEKTNPKLFVSNMSKARRRDRIFIDYHRNKEGATAIAAYSLRARPGATVSTPISWDELDTIRPDQFTLTTVPTRLKKLASDPWDGITEVTQRLKG